MARPDGPGSCPSGPTASRSSGFAAAIPSRGWSFDMEAAPRDGTKVDLMYPEPRGRAINCLWYGDLGFGWIWRTPKWQLGQIEPLPESEWDIHCYPNMEPYAWRLPDEPGALAGEAEGRDRQGSVHEHAARRATPEATPKSSPSQTPVAWKYEYCIPNGEGVWEQRVSLDQPRDGHWIRALEPLFGKSSMHDRAETTEAALRTLQAAGEVR